MVQDYSAHSSDLPILIVEDNREIRLLLEMTLKPLGHEVVSAENGHQALQLYKDRFFPIMLTDWMMPEMNGVELCQKLRASDLPGYVFIVLLTAKDSQKDIITGLEAGADDYLVKPFNNAELKARLRTAKRILGLERTLKSANEEIKLLSITDSLTGSYNRGHLTDRLPNEIKRARRNEQPLSIILCDIDHFKSVNDMHGHQAGDVVLKSFVHTIQESIRDGIDLVFRYGGEEFIILLSETKPDDAVTMAERIRETIAQTPIALPNRKLTITASFGVTGFEPNSNPTEISTSELIDLADRFLYKCKQNGRNCVRGEGLRLS